MKHRGSRGSRGSSGLRSQQGSWALCSCPAVGGVSEIWRKADANVKPRDVTKTNSQDAQSSFGSRMLLVLDLKVKMSKFVLPARPGSCRCSQDLAHSIQGGLERCVRQTKPFCIKVRAVCRDQLLLCPGNTAQTLIYPAGENQTQTIIWSVVTFVLDSFPFNAEKAILLLWVHGRY